MGEQDQVETGKLDPAELTLEEFKIWWQGYMQGITVGIGIGYDHAVDESYPELSAKV